MPRVEANVSERTKLLWDAMAKVIGIPRSNLILVAMSQYIKNNRTLLKIAIEQFKSAEEIKKFQNMIDTLEKELNALKVDGNKMELIK